MTNNFSAQANDITQKLNKLYENLPKSLGNFTDLSDIAFKEGALDKKTKELIALAMSINLRSTDCVLFHLQTLVKQGLTHEELLEVIALVIYMGGGPALIFAADVVQAYEALTQHSTSHRNFDSTRGYEA